MKRKPNHAKERISFSAEEIAAFNFGHLYRTIENQLEQFAVQEGCPYSLSYIADRISGLLHNKAIRESLGNSESLRTVWSNTGKERPGKPSKNLDVAASRKRPLSKAARKAISKAQRARWAKWNKAKQKRKPTPAQLRAYRANAILARAAQVKLRKAA